MDFCFAFADKREIPALLPSLYDVYWDNMTASLPDQRFSEQDKAQWLSRVGRALTAGRRQLVLMSHSGRLAGFFWYYVKDHSLMMEEIQIRREYQGKGLFRCFFRWLLLRLPDNIRWVEAYAHRNNHKSRRILEYLGLRDDEGGSGEEYVHYQGRYALLAERIGQKEGERGKMERIFLTEPAPQYAEDIWQLRQEILDCPDEDQFAGCGNLAECKSAQEWIDAVRLGSDAATCPEGRVPSNIYLAIRERDGRIVGVADLRHHIDHPILGTWGGHTGYYVRPTERRKGYATEILRLNLEKFRQRGIRRVMITCSVDNAASEKVILANGGVFEKKVPGDGTIIKRYWVTL